MGKGDMKTRRGKIYCGTHGKTRPPEEKGQEGRALNRSDRAPSSSSLKAAVSRETLGQ